MYNHCTRPSDHSGNDQSRFPEVHRKLQAGYPPLERWTHWSIDHRLTPPQSGRDDPGSQSPHGPPDDYSTTKPLITSMSYITISHTTSDCWQEL